MMDYKLQARRNNCPAGCRVVLRWMDDVQAPPEGTAGTVVGVDDMGQIMIDWDNGSQLSVILEAGDVIDRVEEDWNMAIYERALTDEEAVEIVTKYKGREIESMTDTEYCEWWDAMHTIMERGRRQDEYRRRMQEDPDEMEDEYMM